MHSYYGGHMVMGGFAGLISFIMHVLIIALIVWLVLFLLRGGRRGRMGMWQAHSALGILNERFAKGEISKEEYEERKKALMSH